MKYSFYYDYSEGGHPEILSYITEHSADQQLGYGEDEYTKLAIKRINEYLKTNADIHFVSSGTQANIVAMASMLKPYQAVIAPTTGHISMFETGAIEATGHKIITCTCDNGKLKPSDIEAVVAEHGGDEHMVEPKVVYLTQATELGTVYSKTELKALAETAKKHNLYTYVDGARLGAALAAPESMMVLSDMAALGLDIFYLGGGKNGALFGEAIVILNDNLKTNFRFYLKQRGALLAKGRILGQQFARMFDDDNLWFKLAKDARDSAAKLAEELKSLDVSFAYKAATNQLFPILPNQVIAELKKDYGFHPIKRHDKNHTVIRLVCSWATPNERIEEFIKDLKHLLDKDK